MSLFNHRHSGLIIPHLKHCAAPYDEHFWYEFKMDFLSTKLHVLIYPRKYNAVTDSWGGAVL